MPEFSVLLPLPECSVPLNGEEGASLEFEGEALLAFEEEVLPAFEERASPEFGESSTSELEEGSLPESERDGGGAGVRVKASVRTPEEMRIAKVRPRNPRSPQPSLRIRPLPWQSDGPVLWCGLTQIDRPLARAETGGR